MVRDFARLLRIELFTPLLVKQGKFIIICKSVKISAENIQLLYCKIMHFSPPHCDSVNKQLCLYIQMGEPATWDDIWLRLKLVLPYLRVSKNSRPSALTFCDTLWSTALC